jgi:RNA polymerase sigma-70 factor (ECF subfamily)
MATTINLKDYYYWYTQDEYIEVSDEVAKELFEDKRYEKTHERVMRREKVYSLDAGDGTENVASRVSSTDNPEAVFDMMERHCGLCRAFNSLPKKQGKRIDAHFILGKSQKEIAEAEGVSEEAVSKAIEKGLINMNKYFKNNF